MPFQRAALFLVLAAFGASACTRMSPEQRLAHDVAQTLGGASRVEQATALTLSGTGRQFNLGQDVRPGLASQTFTLSAYTREYDLTGPRFRVTQTRTPDFAYFQGPRSQTQVQGVDGDVAYNGVPGKATRASATAAAERRTERWHHPLVLIRAALAEGAQLGLGGFPDGLVGAGEQGLAIETADGRVMLVVDAQKRPVRIASGGTHPNLGDVLLTTTFADYAAVDGLQLPTRLTTRVDDFTTGEYQVTHRLAAETGLAAPSEAASAALPAPSVNVAVSELAPGVWLLAGQSHHSAVVAFKDRLVMIEAPQSEARSLAAIARARELRVGTPLTHLVLTHHHFDHSTGLRAAIAEGLTIVTHEGNAAFVNEIAARAFTRAPDALARAPKPATVDPVGATSTITDGTRTLELHHVTGNPHSETMLMAYLPAERILIEVDVFSPGGTYHPYAANLIATVERLKLRVDRVVPLHGAPLTYKELLAAASPAA